MSGSPRLLVTGFGPFPGAPENPTGALMRTLAKEPPEAFGASVLRAVVLKTDYRRSWATLRRLYASFAPDVVVHFGLSAGSNALHVERVGRNCINPAAPDAAGYAPSSPVLSKHAPGAIASTLPTDAILAALQKAGFPAALSDDAGGYVCNATLYRSLLAAPPDRLVGFIHVPEGKRLSAGALSDAATLVLRTSARSFAVNPSRSRPLTR